MSSASTIGYTKMKEYAAGNLNGHQYLSWTGKPAKGSRKKSSFFGDPATKALPPPTPISDRATKKKNFNNLFC